MKLIVLFTVIFLSLPSLAGLPQIILSGDKGETLDGETFDTANLKHKIYLIIHIDPDAASLNKHVDKALEAAHFKSDYYASVAIINAKATWMPNGVIKLALKNQRKKHPNTLYVLDYSKNFVNQWNFKDNSSSYMVLDKKGIPIFRKDGKLSKEDVELLIKTIGDNLK